MTQNGGPQSEKRPCKHFGQHGCEYRYTYVFRGDGTKRGRVQGTDYIEHLRAVHPEDAEAKIDDGGGVATATAIAATNGTGSGKTLIATSNGHAPDQWIHPRLESKPRIWEAFGPAPAALPQNVAHMFPALLVMKALRIEWRMKALVAVLVIGFAWLATYGLDLMNSQVAMVAPLVYFLFAFFLLAIAGPRWTTRPVFVVLKERGHTTYDMQKWWRRHEAHWPDTWRRDVDRESDWMRGQRLLMIDAQEWTNTDVAQLKEILSKKEEERTTTHRVKRRIGWKRLTIPAFAIPLIKGKALRIKSRSIPIHLIIVKQTVEQTKIRMIPVKQMSDADRHTVNELLSKIKPYIPDKIAPPIQRPEGLSPNIPFADHTMADIGEAWAVGHDMRVLAGSHTLRKAKTKQMWIMIGIAACIAGIAVFSFMTMQGINGREKLRLQAEAQIAAQAQIQNELRRQLQQAGIIAQPQPVVPADLIPNK